MLFTVAQPLALVIDGTEVLGAFIGLATLDCVNQPLRLTRMGKVVNAEQFCLFQRLCNLTFSKLVNYQTIFVAANSQSPMEQFVWAQMTIGRHGYVGCNQMPVLKAGVPANRPLTYVIHELGHTTSCCNMCVIKFPHGSFASSVCAMVSTPTAHVKEYCDAVDSYSYNSGGKLQRTVIKGTRIGEETHAIAPFVVDVIREHGASQLLIVNCHTSEADYVQDFINTALSLYIQAVNGISVEKLDQIAEQHKLSSEGFCLAIHNQTGIFAVPLQSNAKYSFDLNQLIITQSDM